MRYGLADRGLSSSNQVVRPSQWMLRELSAGVRWPRLEADLSTSSIFFCTFEFFLYLIICAKHKASNDWIMKSNE